MPVELDSLTGDAWYYDNRTGLMTITDQPTLNVAFDYNDDEIEDAGAVVQAGRASDQYIDLYLSKRGIANPVNLTTATPAVVGGLADASRHMVMWYGWHRRGLLEKERGRSTEIAGIMTGYKEYADDQLDSVIVTSLNGDGNSAVQAIVPTREQACGVWPWGWVN